MAARLIPFILFSVFLDYYLYSCIRAFLGDGVASIIFKVLFLVIILIGYFSFFKLDQKIRDRSLFQGAGINFYIGFLISSIVTKIIYGILMLLYDLVRVGLGIFRVSERFDMPPRIFIIVIFISGIAVLIFLAMIYGMTLGKFNYKLERLSLPFADLPKAFDGFKIVQISDIHAGSYDDEKGLLKGIELINNEEPDVILFTGDLVNDHKDEVNPYIRTIKKLRSKYGTFAVLGNHDYYGAYRQADKDGYWTDFFVKYKEMGFELLNNTSRTIEQQNSKIHIVGVENWGNANWTPKRGDLDLALQGIQADDFCILMTHDPSHWDSKVLPHSKNIQLSLAGHTHGFQFGINLPFLKWSPAQYRYPRWMGIYEVAQQYLYVNRGFGYIAFPGRVGMRPEITVLTLKCL